MHLRAALCNAGSACKTVSVQASGEQQSGVDGAAAERGFLAVVRDAYWEDFLLLNGPRIM